ncbi:ornithine carbamoyltransferase [Clostridium saccharobutylicum]|uniref:Ornithine carbamoyltransferase n=1 Tax=Clostridium saccharobutylicum DSM 13864 TaxID=1345695 RepID=U5MQL3_CLOSA|nr:ornithine carbamoyltransferase [Clostridium saccharobutylicum]AGX41727.1 ornithine carbamoyltransferase ArgF [Clostridium saccharobutylicum DSM 13864]AQR89006.1 ornithine carbamoyltransferase [Clostridium saccharobutylicum]AQR98907.1 ornithine carbamoyltransferase [Clostridium saccharobutylicum]AQS08626.1 ornithine carbamoyltransferase [Clostridium saccharobutylicum]AQS12895.1 ornithine carbamoyltransferase [Clostridium saccharobutylicum]
MEKDLLKMDDLSKEDILDILNLADQLKYEQKHGIEHPHLKGKSLGMIFEKSSTRTRVSFETGMYQLGGNALFLSNRDLQIGRGEPIEDTARVLSRFIQGIMIRTFSQEEIEKLAKYSSIPIINGLTDDEHPCQVLADLMTIRENKNILEGLKIAFIGDGNNMANSLMIGCLKVGMNFSVASPKDYTSSDKYLNRAREIAEEEGVNFTVTTSPFEAAKDADVLITDVWASMGQEEEHNLRAKAFEGFQINKELMAVANKNAMVLHCLPAHRGEEITAEVLEEHADSIFDESENRLHAQKAVLVKLMK